MPKIAPEIERFYACPEKRIPPSTSVPYPVPAAPRREDAGARPEHKPASPKR